MSTEWDAEAGDYVERVLERKLLAFLFSKTVYDINLKEYAYIRMAIDAVMEGYVMVKDEHSVISTTLGYMKVSTETEMSSYLNAVHALEAGCIDVHTECPL